MVSFSYDTSSADISDLSLSLPWHRAGLFFNHGGWTHSFNSVKSLCLEKLKSMPLLFFWTALQGKATPPVVWPGEPRPPCRALESSSPGANAVPLCHETYLGFVVFQSPECIVRRDLCFQLPEWHFYSMMLPVCIAWHEVLKGVRPPGMVWIEIGKDLTPPVCLRESFGTNLYGNSWLIPKGLEPPHTHMVQVIRDCWK